jgi:excisionase family DNA binding protein
MTPTLEELPSLLKSMQAEIAELRQRVATLEGQTPDLLSTEEAAELLGIHPNTAKQWIRTGKLPASKPAGGRNWKINRADVLALIEAGQ